MFTLTYRLRIALTLAAALGMAACETAPPTIQTGPDAEVSFDGLHIIENSKADLAWARPDFDISVYTKIMPLPGGFEYRPVREVSYAAARSTTGPFYIDKRARSAFESLVAEIFREELQGLEKFEWTEAPGPDVIAIQASILDIASFVPPEPVGSRADVYLKSVGEATLVLELRDSETGTILARAIDKRAAENIARSLQLSNRVSNTAAVRRLIRFWAQRLREGLEGFEG